MRVNIVGAGARGRQLLKHLMAISGIEIGFVADPSVEHRGRVAHEFPLITTTAEVAAALRDPQVEAIALATAPEDQGEFARVALESGKHLLVAAPVALEVEPLEQLARLAKEHGTTLALGYDVLFDARVTAMTQLIAGGELGHLRHVHVVHTQLGPHRGPVSAMWALGADDIALIQEWAQLTPVHVSATTGCYLAPSVADVVDATFMYAGGLRSSLHVSWLSPEAQHKITVVGERAMATLDLLQQQDALLVHDRAMAIDTNPDRCRIRDNGTTLVPVAATDPVQAQAEHFVTCCRENRTPRNDVEWALRITRELVAAEHSAKDKGGRVVVGMLRTPPHPGPLRRTFADRMQDQGLTPTSVAAIRPRAIRPKATR